MSVIVIGSINVDLVASGGTIPRPGETVTMSAYAEEYGGKGANQAVAAATLGTSVRLIGATGNDPHARAALADLTSRGVNTDAVITTSSPTGVAMILVAADGENSIAVVPGANADLTPAHVTERLHELPDEPAIVVASLEVPLNAVEAAARVATRRGWPFILNPAPAQPVPSSLLAATAVLTPNAIEVESLGGVATLLAGGAEAIVVTLGGDGATLHRRDEPPRHFPAQPAAVVDTTGAGDAFTAAIAVALLQGESLAAALTWAQVVGAMATEGSGARGSLPTARAVAVRQRRII